MAIAGRIPKCIYCGERIPIVCDIPFDGSIRPDWAGHNKVCKSHPLNKQKEEVVVWPYHGEEIYPEQDFVL